MYKARVCIRALFVAKKATTTTQGERRIFSNWFLCWDKGRLLQLTWHIKWNIKHKTNGYDSLIHTHKFLVSQSVFSCLMAISNIKSHIFQMLLFGSAYFRIALAMERRRTCVRVEEYECFVLFCKFTKK